MKKVVDGRFTVGTRKKFLYVTFFLLTLFSLILAGCTDPDPSTINTCNSASSTRIIGTDWLCIKDVLADQGSGKVCLVKPNENELSTSDFTKLKDDTINRLISDLDISGSGPEGDFREGIDDGLTYRSGDCYDLDSNHVFESFETPASQFDFQQAIEDTLDQPYVPLMFYCDMSHEYSQKGLIVVQEANDEEEELDIYVCHGGKWKDADDLMDDDLDKDGDGASLWWDCNDADPTRHADMSKYGIGEPAAEVCGDRVDNQCLQPYEYNDITFDWDGQWRDSWEDACDNNAFACENNCLWEGNKCDFLGAYNQDFDYYEGEGTAGYCCGAGAVDDLGRTVGDDEICLSTNEDLVSVNLDGLVTRDRVLDAELDDPEANPDNCPSGADWCWVNAGETGGSIEDVQFQVLTVKELGEDPYDVVSNSEEWFFCDANALAAEEEVLGAPEALALRDTANRFYCSQQGTNYVWAECIEPGLAFNDEVLPGVESVKYRQAGDGLYALAAEAVGGEVVLTGPAYDAYYDKSYSFYEDTFDFTGFDYLEFFVTFDQIDALPVSVLLEVFSAAEDAQEEVQYYDGNVLGYAVNAPLLEVGRTVHIKVPIEGDWKDVTRVNIFPGQSTNEITVTNVYLTSDDAPLLCSGDQDELESSWITDMDYSSASSDIRGEEICTTHFGPDAWLGRSDFTYAEVESSSASCCGNQAGEYYAGSTADGGLSACWNGDVVQENETFMNVAYEVSYYLEDKEFDASSEKLFTMGAVDDLHLLVPGRKLSLSETHDMLVGLDGIEDGEVPEGLVAFASADDPDFSVVYDAIEEGDLVEGDIIIFNEALVGGGWSEFIETYVSLPWPIAYDAYEITALEEPLNGFYTVSYEESPQIVESFDLDLRELYDIGVDLVQFDLPYSSEGLTPWIDVYFFVPEIQKRYGDLFVASPGAELPTILTLQIVAETNDLTITENPDRQEVDGFVYPCTQEECLFGLPGSPTYEITNSHPALYDLYFVPASDPDNPVLITAAAQPFTEEGNLLVKSLSQQVTLLGESFYGCQAADFIATTQFGGLDVLTENALSCSVYGNSFCAYQDNGLINSWSQEDISAYGYEVDGLSDEFVSSDDLDLHQCDPAYDTCDAEDRNQSSHAVPGRNFISNADFSALDGEDVLHWAHFDLTGVVSIDREEDFVIDGIYSLAARETLVSERIVLFAEEEYQLSYTGVCEVSATVYDKNGAVLLAKIGPGPIPFTSTEMLDASYMIIEFDGGQLGCELSEPYLQLVDPVFGANLYNYDSEFPLGAGAACCPSDMCWNGQYCVQDMGYTTFLSENVHNDTYRCVAGDWEYVDPKWDWNGEDFGYCDEQTQCFVTSSLTTGASGDYLASDFYDGNYPTCINDGEYILDHYRREGNWSSRTQFLAEGLLNVGDSIEDFALYCTDYRTNLNDHDLWASYLSGVETAPDFAGVGLGDALLDVEPEESNVCFSAIYNHDAGERLVPVEDNTCINNVCVLKFGDSEESKVALAASMNLEISDPNSFLIPLGLGDYSDLAVACPDAVGSETFVECDPTFWYAEEINSLIYAKDGVTLTTGVFDLLEDLWQWFIGLFGAGEFDAIEFLEDTNDFNKLYLLDVNGDSVKVVQELGEGGDPVILAEFEGLDSPVCDYVLNAEYDKVYRDQWPASPEQLVDCSYNETEDVYYVSTQHETGYWWEQLVGELRIFG